MTTTDTPPIASTRPDVPDVQQAPGSSPHTSAQRADTTRILDRKGVKPAVGFLVPIVVLLAWWAVTAAEVFTPVQLPSPTAVFEAAVRLIERGDLWSHIGISLQRVLIGFAIGALLGMIFGAVLGLSRWADALLTPLLGAVRAVPSLAWVPLLILWMRIGEDSKITLIAIGAFFPVFTTLYAGLQHVDPHLVEAGRAFGYKGFRLFKTVQLPAVVPSIFSGLRLALAQAWLFLVAAELIAASMGLGFILTDSQNNGRTDRLILAIILLAVLGKITDTLLGLAEKRAIARWT